MQMRHRKRERKTCVYWEINQVPTFLSVLLEYFIWNGQDQMNKFYILLYFGYHGEPVTCTLLRSWKLTYTYIFALFYTYIPYKLYFLSLKTYIKSSKSKGLGTFHPRCVSITTLKCVTAYLSRQIRHYFIGFLKIPHISYFGKIGR